MARRKDFNNNRFAQIPAPVLNRSLFKRTFGNKFTADEGYLVPVHLDEIYAGDTIDLNLTTFMRMTTPITPIMDNLNMDLHAFFVPSRLVMKDYYKMLGEQVNPGDSTNVLIPQISHSAGGFKEHSLADYFGIPTKINIPNDDLPIALPFRAYNLIYNDWFRDENLQDSIYVNTSLDKDVDTNYPLRRRNKRHDYFTSCLPFAQKGSAVELSFTGSADLVFPKATGGQFYSGYSNTDNNWTRGTAGLSTSHLDMDVVYGSTPNSAGRVHHSHTFDIPMTMFRNATIDSYANLSSASSLTINDLREAISVQHILERRARGGTRDVEILQSTYGVSPSDDRMQRPELLSVSRSSLNLSTVAQTSETTGSSPLGDLSAIGVIQGHIKVKYSAVENGYLMILASTRADISYQQGMPRMFSKRSFLDVLDPMRSHIGEQPVKRKEILTTSDTTYNNEVFGYLPNYDDLRFGRNLITGSFRSNATNSLDIWHFSEVFNETTNKPVLSSEFITQNSPVKRVLAVQDNPDFFGDVFVKCNHFRVLPTFGTPGLRRI